MIGNSGNYVEITSGDLRERIEFLEHLDAEHWDNSNHLVEHIKNLEKKFTLLKEENSQLQKTIEILSENLSSITGNVITGFQEIKMSSSFTSEVISELETTLSKLQIN